MYPCKIVHNLAVIDFSAVAETIFQEYSKEVNLNYGVVEDDLKLKDRNKIKLYYTLKTVVSIQNTSEDRRNMIFYVNLMEPKYIDIYNAIAKLAKIFPIPIYLGTLPFDQLENDPGEWCEFTIGIKEYRFSADFNNFSRRKIKDFLAEQEFQLAGYWDFIS